MGSKAWGVVLTTLNASKALRAGQSDNLPDGDELNRGFQRRRTDNPSPADDRPAPPHSHTDPLSQIPHGGYGPSGQQQPPQRNPNPYYPESTYQHSQGYDSTYYPQQDHASCHNTFPYSHGGTPQQSIGHLQNPPNGDPRYENADRYRANQGYSGQPYPDPNQAAYNPVQSSYHGPTPHGQAQANQQYSQSSSPDQPYLNRATTTPASFPHSHRVPTNPR